LAGVGSAIDAIDHVVLTHLHFDHAGGLSRYDADDAPVATFPGATHWVQKKNWGWANSPSARDAGSYREIDFGFFEDGDVALELVDGPAEILPGIEVFPMNGHTFGMQVVKVTTPGGVYCHLADLIPTASHLRDPYVMGYDLQPLVTVEEKRALLWDAVRNDWILVYEHDPETAMSRVEFDSRGRPRAVPVEG
jgi:glyoxylase-like metal-dependent hydrolase (beta-lactamase superfamily II)